MRVRLLVVLEQGASASKVSDYLVRACAGESARELEIILFMELPGLPPWIEAGESGDIAAQRRQFEADSRAGAKLFLGDIRQQLVAQGVSNDAISEELAEAPDGIVADILASARRHGCDTIVMARHHKSMVREFFEGDSEEKLLRHPTGFTVWLIE